MIKRNLLLTVFAVASAGVIGLNVTGNAYAETEASGFFQRIRERFQTNIVDGGEDAVQRRVTYRLERHSDVDEKLGQAVEAGKLTAEQKSELLSKMEEWSDSKANWFDLSPEERQQNAAQHRAEIEAWEDSQGIDVHEVIGYGGGAGQFRNGKGFCNRSAQ